MCDLLRAGLASLLLIAWEPGKNNRKNQTNIATCEEGRKLLRGCRGGKRSFSAEFDVGKWAPSQVRWQVEQEKKQQRWEDADHWDTREQDFNSIETKAQGLLSSAPTPKSFCLLITHALQQLPKRLLPPGVRLTFTTKKTAL